MTDPLKQSAEAAWAYLIAGGHTELVTYTPADGAPRQIHALVERSPRQAVVDIPAPRFRVTVRNHATAGIEPAALDTQRDTLHIADRLGETPTARPIGEIAGQDAAELILEVT